MATSKTESKAKTTKETVNKDTSVENPGIFKRTGGFIKDNWKSIAATAAAALAAAGATYAVMREDDESDLSAVTGWDDTSTN